MYDSCHVRQWLLGCCREHLSHNAGRCQTPSIVKVAWSQQKTRRLIPESWRTRGRTSDMSTSTLERESFKRVSNPYVVYAPSDVLNAAIIHAR